MKAYGLPRNKNIESPDVADIKEYGLKTFKGGRDYFKNKTNKNKARRRWKRKERIKNKVSIFDENIMPL